MKKRLIHYTSLLIALLVLGVTAVRAQVTDSQAGNTKETVRSEFQLSTLLAQSRRRPRLSLSFSLMPSSIDVRASAPFFSITPMATGPNLPVLGSGTVGRLTKWTGFNSSNSFIGDSSIFEDKYGNVSIGTGTSTVTVAGTIQASGGTTVAHDSTLQGDGTSASRLGVAVPLVLTGLAGSGALIDATNTAHGGLGVRAVGGDGASGPGGAGLTGVGGDSSGAGNFGGTGIEAFAGLGLNGAAEGVAGLFQGDVEITGKLKVDSGMKMFHIDHPLDPENKYLNHVAIESSEVLNVYSGNVTTDTNGDAVVTLPDWFEALNADFRYQLTVVGTFAQAVVARKIKGNCFAIKTNGPGVEVSWQVTGVRSDPAARKHPLEVEEAKTERERGYYLNPEAYGQPEERGMDWARHPQMMQQRKQRR